MLGSHGRPRRGWNRCCEHWCLFLHGRPPDVTGCHRGISSWKHVRTFNHQQTSLAISNMSIASRSWSSALSADIGSPSARPSTRTLGLTQLTRLSPFASAFSPCTNHGTGPTQPNRGSVQLTRYSLLPLPTSYCVCFKVENCPSILVC